MATATTESEGSAGGSHGEVGVKQARVVKFPRTRRFSYDSKERLGRRINNRLHEVDGY